MKKYFGIFCAAALMFSAACSSTTGDDGDATSDQDIAADGSTDEADAGATDTAGDAGGQADAVAPASSYTWVVIYDDTKTCTGTGPGADIDVVAVYRGGKLIGVGKPGTVVYAAPAHPAQTCTDKKNKNKHAEEDDVKAAAGPLGDIDAKEVSTGYLSLGTGSVELQIGGCANGETDIHKCDGKGDAVAFENGDEIDVYEVDKWYQDTENPMTKKKYITGQCKCAKEPYSVYLRKTQGLDVGSVEVGSHTGTAIQNLKVKGIK